jgi:hypothetical protein
MAGTTGLEPATSDVTGRRSNQLNYVPAFADFLNVARSSHPTKRPSQHVHLNLGITCENVIVYETCTHQVHLEEIRK